MSMSQGKRKREELASEVSASLSNEERMVYNIIRSKEGMGIWQGNIKKECNIPESLLKKSIKSLLTKALIKEVVNIHNKSKKLLMAVDFQPSKEITGGEWYSEGKLDTQFIQALSEVCCKIITRQKVATRDGILDWVKTVGSQVFPGGVSQSQVEQILEVLVLENKVQQVKSTGFGDFASVPVGNVCYRLVKKDSRGAGGADALKDTAMTSIPCGVCPRINLCTPDGIISPVTCEYYQKWLDF
ncbi:hypothetical protein RJT34_30776 [Clitoria ternatea]|uniref:DNA-directed RNA polymerase III subunit RPC6 n=1 Tax=Clitoria ternatea TaxID=43366 RepID=A0AAN9EXL4_CLITE